MPSLADGWERERTTLLGKRISDLGLSLHGSPVERMVQQLYAELAAKDLSLRPPVYLSDEWGCPEGTPLIGVPFYLADERLARIEDEEALGLEQERDMMKYLRHEAGHAFNYAYQLHQRPEWVAVFGPYDEPYRARYRADPFSRAFVRHILGWYAQKHPDEDFAETFAVWLTPGLDWRRTYEGWPALTKLEYVERAMRSIGGAIPSVPSPTADDLPVEAMDYTVADHYRSGREGLPLHDERQFDGDLATIFCFAVDAPLGEPAAEFIKRHRREIVTRISYWTAESSSTVRAFVDMLALRAERLGHRVRGLDASTLIELTAFGTAVMMNHRYTETIRSSPRRGD
ncbi:MAG: putative zinc-binding metallopeptidase [Gemmatimonadaceae bacterium]